MKKQIKKLNLNKKTIVNLKKTEMAVHVGGASKGHNFTCYTCNSPRSLCNYTAC